MNDNAFGVLLRGWRGKMKQTTLADDLGWSHSKISRWETGSVRPKSHDREDIIKLAKALRLTLPETNELLRAANLREALFGEFENIPETLQRLRDDTERVDYLYWAAGFPVSEIAIRLNISESEVNSAIRGIEAAKRNLAAEPTWVRDLAQRLRMTFGLPNLLDIPSGIRPRLSNVVPEEDYQGNVTSYFYWEWETQRDLATIRLVYPYGKYRMLEKDPYFDKFLVRRPMLKSLVENYKIWAGRFITCLGRLFKTVEEKAGRKLGEFLRRQAFQIPSGNPDLLKAETTCVRVVGVDVSYLSIFGTFVEGACVWAIWKAAMTERPGCDLQEPEYRTFSAPDGMTTLGISSFKLARGNSMDIERLLKLHQDFRQTVRVRDSGQLQNIVRAWYKASELAQELRDQL